MRSTLVISILLIFVWACGSSHNNNELGKAENLGAKVFKENCAICHGDDGRRGLTGAKIIPDSELTEKQRIMLIAQGKGNMMPYRGLLSEEEIKAVAAYTATLK